MSLLRTVARGLCVALLLPALGWSQSSFEQADALIREGDYVRALEVASAEQDPLHRAQTQLHVYYYAGDLDAALAHGRAGLAIDPNEPWLLKQSAMVALSLGVGRPANEWLGRLEQVSPGQAPAWMLERAAELHTLRAAETAALSRARTVALTLLSALVLGLLYGVLNKGVER